MVLVPTMGALHAAHLSLMRLARSHGDQVLASIFVNPTQFAPGEDLDAYPRDEVGDLAKAESAGCDAVFLPSVEAMYPPGAATEVSCPTLASGLCGQSRPTHFTGVCTIVLKLFNITRCDAAVFGEKDFQQLAIIRRMTADLDLDIQIISHPIVREPDGLAMSSRNIYLSPADRESARCLSEGMRAAQAAWAGGERDAQALIAAARRLINAGRIDYLEIRDAASLMAIEGPVKGPAVLATAVFFGQTRLLDNTVLITKIGAPPRS